MHLRCVPSQERRAVYVIHTNSNVLVCALTRDSAFRKVLSVPNPTCMVSLPAVGKLFVLHEGGLFSYSLDMMCRAGLGLTSSQTVDSTRECISTDVMFFRAGRIGSRYMGEF